MVLDASNLFLLCRKFRCKKHEKNLACEGWSKQEQDYKM